MRLENSSVSMTGQLNSMPSRLHSSRKNAVSKEALCAARAALPINSNNCGMATLASGAPCTMLSLIPVISVIFAGIAVPGLTICESSSTICPF